MKDNSSESNNFEKTATLENIHKHRYYTLKILPVADHAEFIEMFGSWEYPDPEKVCFKIIES